MRPSELPEIVATRLGLVPTDVGLYVDGERLLLRIAAPVRDARALEELRLEIGRAFRCEVAIELRPRG